MHIRRPRAPRVVAMAGIKGIAAVARLRVTAGPERGGQERKALPFTRATPDALAVCAESWLDALRSRNYAEGTLEGGSSR